MTREATLCQNILNALRIFARISKFRCFHETKQTQNEVGRFFYNLAEFVFEYFSTVGEFQQLCKVLYRFAFRNMIVPLPKSQNTSSSARSSPPPSPTHAFLTQTKLYKPLPLFAVFFAFTKFAKISATKNNMSRANTKSVLARCRDNNWEKGRDFVKTFYVKKLMWEREGSLSGRWMTCLGFTKDRDKDRDKQKKISTHHPGLQNMSSAKSRFYIITCTCVII